MLWKVIVCWSSYEYKDVTRRSREGKMAKKGENLIGWGTEWRSRVTSRPRVHGPRCQWLKNLKKKTKKPRNLKGNCYEILLGRGDAKFLPHSPWHLQYNLYFSLTVLLWNWIYFGIPCISSLRRVWSKNWLLRASHCFGYWFLHVRLSFCCKWDQPIHMIF